MSERNEPRSNKNNSAVHPREMRPNSGDVTSEARSKPNARHKSAKAGTGKRTVDSVTSSASDWEAASRHITGNGATMDRKAMPPRSATDRPKTSCDLAVYSTTENNGHRHKSSAHRARSQYGSSMTSSLRTAETNDTFSTVSTTQTDDTFSNVSESQCSTVSTVVGAQPVKRINKKLEYMVGATTMTLPYSERLTPAGDPETKLVVVTKQLPSSVATVPSGAGAQKPRGLKENTFDRVYNLSTGSSSVDTVPSGVYTVPSGARAQKPWAVKESTFDRVYCLSTRPLEPEQFHSHGRQLLTANSILYKLYCVPPKC